MALRLLEIVVPEEAAGEVLNIVAENQITNFWQTCSCESRNIFKMIIAAEKTENLLDTLQKKYGHLENFHMVRKEKEKKNRSGSAGRNCTTMSLTAQSLPRPT